MKLTIQIGEVAVKVTGLDVTVRQVTALMREAARLAAGLEAAPEAEPERTPLGFAVITERGDEPEPRSYFTDDDE